MKEAVRIGYYGIGSYLLGMGIGSRSMMELIVGSVMLASYVIWEIVS